ncbi:MAG TPA: purine-nucleoside phosphorylase [bacterium]|nr:purine-nucleoside phosphorylase [bacterium]
MTDRARIDEAVAAIRRRTGIPFPQLGIILGSGLGSLADAAATDVVIPYADIPRFPVPNASGHPGRLVVGRLEDRPVIMMQGRVHLYEGYTSAEVTLSIRVLAALGVRILIVTNAAGGITRRFRPGDLMVITDHINFTGTNPLIGPNDEALGPRFPDLSGAYDPDLVVLALRAARDEGVPVRQGVYLAVSGPSYETPAELTMMARWGADAVGMSTVSEVIVARHAGIRVLGISAITNVAGGAEPPSHEAVLRAARDLEPHFIRLIRRIVRDLPASGADRARL